MGHTVINETYLNKKKYSGPIQMHLTDHIIVCTMHTVQLVTDCPFGDVAMRWAEDEPLYRPGLLHSGVFRMLKALSCCCVLASVLLLLLDNAAAAPTVSLSTIQVWPSMSPSM